MTQAPTISISHVGICVSDLDRSLKFYTEALGFEALRVAKFAKPFEVLTELPVLVGRAHFIGRDGATFELLAYSEPGTIGPAERRPMNQLGLTHMALTVDDVDAVAERIVQHGGRRLDHTRVDSPGGTLMFCTDPDGVRLELWKKPG